MAGFNLHSVGLVALLALAGGGGLAPPPGYPYPVGPGRVNDSERGLTGMTYAPQDWTSVSNPSAYGTLSLPDRGQATDGSVYGQHRRFLQVPTLLKVGVFHDGSERSDIDVVVNGVVVFGPEAITAAALSSYVITTISLPPGDTIVQIRYRGNGDTFYFDYFDFVNA